MILNRKMSIIRARFLSVLFCAGLALASCMHAPAIDEGVMLGKHLVENEKDYDRAIWEMEKIVAAKPNAGGLTWYWLGRARFHKGLYPQAAAAFEKAVQRISRVEKEGAYDYLGWSYYHSAEYLRAINAFDNAVDWSQSTPGPGINWNSLCGRGWAGYFIGDFERALRDLNEALLQIPRNNTGLMSFCHRGLAFTHLALGNDAEALASVEKARVNPAYERNFDLALIYLVQGEKEKAYGHWGGAGSAGVLIRDYQEGRVGGVLIVETTADGPAAAAGLMPGDIMKSIDGQPVVDIRGFLARITGSEPGTSVPVTITRNGIMLNKTMIVGSAETLMAKQHLIAPVLKARPITPASIAAPPPPASLPAPGEPFLEQPVQATFKEPPAPSVEPVKKEPVISIDTVSVTPQEVPAGETFSVRIGLYAENPGDIAPRIAVTLHYAVSRNGKVLKRFNPETLTVSNGEMEIITKTIRAGKTIGDYTVDIRFEHGEENAERSAEFSIK